MYCVFEGSKKTLLRSNGCIKLLQLGFWQSHSYSYGVQGLRCRRLNLSLRWIGILLANASTRGPYIVINLLNSFSAVSSEVISIGDFVFNVFFFSTNTCISSFVLPKVISSKSSKVFQKSFLILLSSNYCINRLNFFSSLSLMPLENFVFLLQICHLKTVHNYPLVLQWWVYPFAAPPPPYVDVCRCYQSTNT